MSLFSATILSAQDDTHSLSEGESLAVSPIFLSRFSHPNIQRYTSIASAKNSLPSIPSLKKLYSKLIFLSLKHIISSSSALLQAGSFVTKLEELIIHQTIDTNFHLHTSSLDDQNARSPVGMLGSYSDFVRDSQDLITEVHPGMKEIVSFLPRSHLQETRFSEDEGSADNTSEAETESLSSHEEMQEMTYRTPRPHIRRLGSKPGYSPVIDSPLFDSPNPSPPDDETVSVQSLSTMITMTTFLDDNETVSLRAYHSPMTDSQRRHIRSSAPFPSVVQNESPPSFWRNDSLDDTKKGKYALKALYANTSTILASLILPELTIKLISKSKNENSPLPLPFFEHISRLLSPHFTDVFDWSSFSDVLCHATLSNPNSPKLPPHHYRSYSSIIRPIKDKTKSVHDKTLRNRDDHQQVPPLTEKKIAHHPSESNVFLLSIINQPSSESLVSHKQLPAFTVSPMSDSTDNLHAVLKYNPQTKTENQRRESTPMLYFQEEIRQSQLTPDMQSSLTFLFTRTVNALISPPFLTNEIALLIAPFISSPVREITSTSSRFIYSFLQQDINSFYFFSTKREVESLHRFMDLEARFRTWERRSKPSKIESLHSVEQSSCPISTVPDQHFPREERDVAIALFSVYKFNNDQIPLLNESNQSLNIPLIREYLAFFKPFIAHYHVLRHHPAFQVVDAVLAFIPSFLRTIISIIDSVTDPLSPSSLVTDFNCHATQLIKSFPHPPSSPFYWTAILIDLIGFSQLHEAYPPLESQQSTGGTLFSPIKFLDEVAVIDDQQRTLQHLIVMAARTANKIFDNLLVPFPIPSDSHMKWKGTMITSVQPVLLSVILPYLRKFMHSQLMKEEEYVVMSQSYHDSSSPDLIQPKLLTFYSDHASTSAEFCKLYLNVMLCDLDPRHQLVFIVDTILRHKPANEPVERLMVFSTARKPHPYHPRLLVLHALVRLASILKTSDELRAFFIKEIPNSLVVTAQFATLHANSHIDSTNARRNMNTPSSESSSESDDFSIDDQFDDSKEAQYDEELQVAVTRVFEAYTQGNDEILDPDRLALKWIIILINGFWEMYSTLPYPPPPSKILIRPPVPPPLPPSAATNQQGNNTTQSHVISPDPPPPPQPPQITPYSIPPVDMDSFVLPFGQDNVNHATLRALLTLTHSHPPDKYSVLWYPIFAHLFIPSRIRTLPARDQNLLSYLLRLYLVTIEPTKITDYTGYTQLFLSNSVLIQATLTEYLVEALSPHTANSLSIRSIPFTPMREEYLQRRK
ncbi:hypothetical protein BLNAU_7389 [Blattamonas nauphoetae]|uniref:Uncharacterized protein n=1 Tax=Blattamonas nauphoetae TaxID=2049346 RepID=A0ABQ9Y1X1_9EUKA|nr:hypothetical protein BLNAU_7389 [Blattamonas nauphoetae]